jgi:seryl-tRNA(Sec) selenium transferase
MPNEFLVHRTHMNPYDRIIPVAGARLVEFGYARYTKPWQMEEAITENTAGVFYFFYRGGWRHEHSALTLQETIDIAHSHDLRVIVDAAGQLPPPENLSRFTAMGADLVVFSGGKGLRGPQSSGLLFGPRDLIQACQLMGPPNHNIGRSMKVPKEEIVGLVAAVERYLSLDHQREIENYEKVVARLVEAISGISGLQASRRMPGDSGEPYPFCEVRFPGENATARRDWMVENLLNLDPPIYVSSILRDCVSINALCLGEGQEETIIEAISDLSRQMPADPAENAGA